MMETVIQIPLSEIVAVALAVGGSFAAIFAGIGKFLLSSFLNRQRDRDTQQDEAREKEHAQIEARLAQQNERVREIETSLNETLTKLPLEYQRREDAIRFETVLNAKLDAIGTRIERLMEKS